jgi:nucleotide-binding universal stress UspA family protein
MRLLYATDGFRPAVDAGELLEAVADRERTSVEVLAVAEYTPIPASKEDERERVEAIAEQAAGGLAAAGFAAERRTVEGVAHEEIVRRAEDGAFDLVVVGAGKNSWLGHLLLGSVSTRVLHHAPASLLIVHGAPGGSPPYGIVAAVDGSQDSEFAIEALIELADPRRCAVDVASVAEPLATPAVGPGGAYVDAEAYEETTSRVVRTHEDYLRAAIDRLRAAGFPTEGDVLVGHPATQILNQVAEKDAALAIVGSRGHGALGRLLLGSVSDRVARHAPATLVARRRA